MPPFYCHHALEATMSRERLPEIDLTRPERQVQGAGPLDGGTRRGALLHVICAFTPDGTPLGVVQAIPWTRDDDEPRNAAMTRGQRAATPIEEKESFRWKLSMQQAIEEARRCPRPRIIYVADSEAPRDLTALHSGEG
jgi:hypothetical protein